MYAKVVKSQDIEGIFIGKIHTFVPIILKSLLMEYYEFNTFKFFRRYFNLPKGMKLQWCVIEEMPHRKPKELRLGILLPEYTGGKYIDVAQRRMFSQVECGLICRKAWPAKRTLQDDNYLYQTEIYALKIVCTKHFIADIYRSSWYTDDSPSMMLL